MPPAYVLSENDSKVLKDLVSWWRALPKNADPSHSRYTSRAPECYVAKIPSAGIAPITLVSGGDDQPGYATCDIYKVDPTTSPPTLVQFSGRTERVYNVGNAWVDATYAVVNKSKEGQWVVDCPCVEGTGTGTTTPTGTGSTGTGSTGTGTTGTGSPGCIGMDTMISMVTGVQQFGSTLVISRTSLTFKNGLLCETGSLPNLEIDTCCNDAGTGFTGTGSGAGGGGANGCGQCYWQWNGSSWDKLDYPPYTCSGTCTCSAPVDAGDFVGDYRATNCAEP